MIISCTVGMSVTAGAEAYSVRIYVGTNTTVTPNGKNVQTELTGAMTTVTFTAKSGYMFPEENEAYGEHDGVTLTRTSNTELTASGTPTANVSFTTPDPYPLPPTCTISPSDTGTVAVDQAEGMWSLKATPETGYRFVKWTYSDSYLGDTESTENPCSFSNYDIGEGIITNITAVFEELPAVTYTPVSAKAATCTATGNKEYYKGSDGKLYTKSGDTYTETTLAAVTVAKTAHTLTAVEEVAATCTADGVKAHYKCSVCEKLFEDADGKTETTADALKVTKLGHNYVDGKCTRCGASEPNGGYAPYIPSYTPSTAPATTNVAPAPTIDIKNYKITGTQDAQNESALTWDAIPDASAYSLYIKVGDKYVYIQDLGTAKNADVVRATNGKYYVSTGGDYAIYKYDTKTGKFTNTGTLEASKIDSIKKANNVTEDFMVKYTVNGKESTESNSYKVSVNIYYKPAVQIAANKRSITLKWNNVPEAKKYRVYKLVNGKLRLVTETNKLAAMITGTKSGKEYSYAVRAYVNGKWTKVYKSDIVSVTAT